MIGAPGRVTPVIWRPAASEPPGNLKAARYQMLGMPSPRCMSLATSAAPFAVWAPDSANALEPTTASGSRGSVRSKAAARAVGAGRPIADTAARLRRSITLGPGTGAAGPFEPSSAASSGVKTGAKNASESAPNWSRSVISVRS